MPALSDRAAFAEHRFSTSALPPDKRLTFWRDTFASSVVRLADVRVPARDQFQADALIRAVPGLRMPSFTITAAEMRRTSASVGDGDDAVVLLTPAQGKLSIAQRGREVILRPGDAVLMLHGEPSAVSTAGKARFRGFIVPRTAIATGLAPVEDAAVRRIPANHGLLQLLKSYVRAAVPHLSAPESEPARGLVASHIHDLIAAIVAPVRGGTDSLGEKGIGAARLAAAKADMIAEIGRGEVTVVAIAARQKITARSLQRLFEAEGSTFSAFKLEQQLQLVRRLLASRIHASRTIASLAYAGGFSDLSYFHRSFRRRFGAAPSDFRGSLREEGH